MAGIIKAGAVQLGDSATATQNFTLRTNIDGTATLARGNVGATTQDILTIASDGVVSFPLKPIAPRQFMIVEDQKAAGSAGGSSSAGDNIRVLNTVVSNTITGASLASNQVTLPAGTYRVTAMAPALNPDFNRIRLVNVTDSSVLILGVNSFAQAGGNNGGLAFLDGIFTITGTKAINLTHYITTAQATNGLGLIVGDSQTAVFAHITFEKL